jgi:hypothetical protein
MDIERNSICAVTLAFWALILLSLSTMAGIVKCLCLVALVGLLAYHVKRTALTYESTFACLVASGLLYLSDPKVLPQTVFLVYGLLLLASLCLFMSVEALLLALVFGLALTYSAFLTVAVAAHADPAFTSLFLLVLTTFWLVFLRPNARNVL